MDLNILESRNKEAINKLLKSFKIEFKYEQLIEEFNSIYISTDLELKRIRLLGVQNIYSYDNDIKVKVNGETKRTQIYVLNKKEFEKLEMEDINTVLSKLTFLKNLWYQNLFLKNISEIESFMSFNDSFKYLNGIEHE
ncbi:hypothetical protein [Aliarcobacter butzleri]|uniref:hypothetical protein n=1 Tax=Aliarcobacter butzleri TaxID=28197 RepID=UPI0021B34658|nr:hypothetical protein [Aliarcobacter butzleri]MCT7596133.1 hypothetical protein [Aliarcobacter butzleri]